MHGTIKYIHTLVYVYNMYINVCMYAKIHAYIYLSIGACFAVMELAINVPSL